MTDIFIRILNMSLMASVVAILVILLRFPMKKLPKIYSYMLWAVVFFRLVCPFTLESILSLVPVKPDSISISPVVETGIKVVDIGINNSISTFLPSADPTVSVNLLQILLTAGMVIWIAGIFALTLYFMISYFKFKSNVITATLIKDNIYETDKISTPVLFGLIRPRIYLPLGLVDTEQSYVIKHEQTHINRKDYMVKPIAFFACTLHWFNPVVWFCYILMIRDMEMSCDENVMKNSPEDIRKNYSASLLSMAVKQKRFLSPLAFGEENVKQRIKNVASYKKPKIWIILAAVLIVLTITIGFSLNPVTPFNYDKTIEKAVYFSCDSDKEQDVAEKAFYHFYSFFMKKNIPDKYREIDVNINKLIITSGDISQFSVIYDFGRTFPQRNGDGATISYGHNYQSFRITNTGSGNYRIVYFGSVEFSQEDTPAGREYDYTGKSSNYKQNTFKPDKNIFSKVQTIEADPEPIKLPYIISKNKITFTDGSSLYLNLELIEGDRYNRDTGLGYKNTVFEGKFAFRVYKSEEEYDNPLFMKEVQITGEAKSSFSGEFSIIFGNYNGDGQPEFTIGQYGSSNGNFYDIYTIDEKGIVSKLDVESGPMFISQRDYSIALNKVDGVSFSYVYYNNVTSDYMVTVRTWDEDDKKFIIKTNKVFDPQKYLEELLLQAPKDYFTTAVLTDNCFVIEKDELKSDIDIFISYQNKVNKGSFASLVIYNFTEENGTILTGLLSYGDKFYSVRDDTFQYYEYQYQNFFENNGKIFMFLSNDPNATYDNIVYANEPNSGIEIFSMNTPEGVVFRNSVNDESLKEFYAAMDSSGYKTTLNDKFINITPVDVLNKAGVLIFKNTSGYDCESYILEDGKAYHIGAGFGGFGLTSIVPFDVNRDGVTDLVYAYSFGSGIHRSVIGWFDMKDLTEKIVTDQVSQNTFRQYDLILKANNENITVYKIESNYSDIGNYPSYDDIAKMQLENDSTLVFESGQLINKK